MNSHFKPKPIQIRLPKDLEDSLRYVAYKTSSTLNSVVIECLKENLPTVNELELALYDGLNFCIQSEDQLFKEVYDRLGRYQKAIQLQLALVLQISSLLNSQASHASRMRDGILNGVKLKVPEDNDGKIPDMISESGISPEVLNYVDASNLLKSETEIRKLRKEIVRHQYDAAGEWEYIKEVLRRVDKTVASTHPSVR